MKKISYEEEPAKWIALHNAALGNLSTAIIQLKRLGFCDGDIVGSLGVEMKRYGDTS
jgi:hypothetical protein